MVAFTNTRTGETYLVVLYTGAQTDEEVIAAANEHGIAMVLTGIRHFRH